MTTPKITPKVVKTIETALEERKTKADRRNKAGDYSGSERRTGKDRRDIKPN
jgi:hypothetical protein